MVPSDNRAHASRDMNDDWSNTAVAHRRLTFVRELQNPPRSTNPGYVSTPIADARFPILQIAPSMTRFRLIAVVALTASALGACFAHAQPADVLLGWERLREACEVQSCLAVTSTIRQAVRGGPSPSEGSAVILEQLCRVEGEHAHFKHVLSFDDAPVDKRTEVIVNNGDYQFKAVRGLGEDVWSLRDTMPSRDVATIGRELPEWNRHAFRPVAINGVLLPELAKIPDVSVGAPVSADGLTQLTFRFDGQAGPFGGDVDKLIVWLDSEHDYRIVRAATEPKSDSPRPLRQTWECTYDPTTGLVATAKETSHRERPDMSPPAAAEEQVERRYDWSYPGPTDRSELYLAFYGLPEPEFRTPGSYRTPLWLYYFIGGVLFVGVGAFFAHRAVRRKA